MEEKNNNNIKRRTRKGIDTAKKIQQSPKPKKVVVKPPQKKSIKNPSALKKANQKLANKKTLQTNIERYFKKSPKDTKTNVTVKKHLEKNYLCAANDVVGKNRGKNNASKENKGLRNEVKNKVTKKLSPENGQKDVEAKKAFNCKLCQFQTPYLSSYKIHMDIHEGIKYECKACTHTAASKGALLSHMRRSSLCKPHLDPTKQERKHRAPPKKYKCQLCSYEGSTKKCLSDHKLIHMPKDQLPQFPCSFCPFIAIRKNNLARHKRLLHAEDMGVKMEILQCYHCDYTSTYKTNLIDHIKRHFKERKIYACEYCDLTFIYKMAYMQHEQTHLTEGVKYECPEPGCKYWMPKKYMLRKHMLRHKSEHQVRMFQCPNCSHRTKYRASFRKHLENMCNISWEQWKQEHDQIKPPKNKENGKTDTENAKTDEINNDEHQSESETDWEFSLSDQEI